MIFDSNFESGNLDKVSIVSLDEYNLFLNVDTNTKGQSMWFYFAVTNVEKDRTVTFNIMNCAKPFPAPKGQLIPLSFSEIEYESTKTEWIGNTSKISYGRNNLIRKSCIVNEGLYTLSFSYTFKYSGDKVYFAYNKPYTVTMYNEMLTNIRRRLKDESKNFVILPEDGLNKKLKQFISIEKTQDQKTSKVLSGP